ncbi:MAG: hypothetical protein K9H16_00620 [Bacteroidales bacterium]|nr:hypothetical protein [Bacteroidales bacterium]
MKPLNPYNYWMSFFVTLTFFSISSTATPNDNLMLFDMFSGINLMGMILIAGILFLGYFARSKFDSHHNARNEKS